MAHGPRRIKVAPGSELARLLEEARGGSLLLEKDGELYRLNREEREDLWAGYDPDKVREALAETAGSWADIDTDSLIADIYRAREEGSQPADRP